VADGEAKQWLEWVWNESQERKKLRCAQKEEGPIHIYRVTGNTQIWQMSKDTRRTQLCGVVETLV